MNAEQVVRVTAQSFAQYRDDLIVLLLDAVGHGASVGFMNDLDQPQASRYFNEVHGQLEQGNLLLWVLVEDQRVLASVQLVLCQKANGLNRAEVQKLLVLNEVRRRGMGQVLIHALEQGAREQKRGLLHLDTEAGSPARTSTVPWATPAWASCPTTAKAPTATTAPRPSTSRP
jgi:Acetyltransferase (GNAT) family.